MRYSYSLATTLVLYSFASGLPVKRAASATDLVVLQFAHVLEQLETTFYTQALSTFQESDFISAGFSSAAVAVEQFQSILNDESTHTSVLAQTILDQGGTPITGCSFDFSTVLTDVSTMVATARVVEMAGVSAYLGAAGLISDPQLLTAAASIVTVEARHQSILNVLNGMGLAIPQAFDIPLSPSQVLAIAGPFISGCELGVPANPSLQVTNTGTIGVGTALTFDMSSLNGTDPSSLSCQMMVGGAPFSISQPLSSCIVPDINGPVAVFLTNSDQPLANSQLVQFTAEIVAGPLLTFIDSGSQTIMQLARSTGMSSDSSTVISPAEASSIVASASSTGAAVSSSATASSAVSSDDSANNVEQAPGGPNFATGPSGDGHTIVMGWQNLPAGITPSS